ncbi:MAG: hypothetical protein HY726_00150 [Candidatus Rokubacteria bacterium]|nr:hypothetical protein [Candidatus Rokubacteria bacterium]
MSCEREPSRLIELLEEELPVPEAAELRAHLEGCRECAAALAGLKATRAALEALPLQDPSEASWGALRADISRRLDPQARPGVRRLRWLWPVAAVPLAAAAGLLLVWRASPPVRTPAPTMSVATVVNDPSLDAWLLEAPVRELNRYAWAAPFLLTGDEAARELGYLVEITEARQAGVVQRVDHLVGLNAREVEQLVAALEKGASR